MRALEYFIEHEGRRPPFVQLDDDGKRAVIAKPLPEITQPKEKAEFAVVLQAFGEKKIEVIRDVRALMRLGLKKAKDLVEGAQKNVKEAWRKTGREHQGHPRKGRGQGRAQVFLERFAS
jgi:Ribosomal protein L7/L12 C-terminal domain